MLARIVEVLTCFNLPGGRAYIYVSGPLASRRLTLSLLRFSGASRKLPRASAGFVEPEVEASATDLDTPT